MKSSKKQVVVFKKKVYGQTVLRLQTKNDKLAYSISALLRRVTVNKADCQILSGMGIEVITK